MENKNLKSENVYFESLNRDSSKIDYNSDSTMDPTPYVFAAVGLVVGAAILCYTYCFV